MAVHEVAAEIIDDRGLDAGTPYWGWHLQFDGFTRKGELRTILHLQHGGSWDGVQRAAATAPARFEAHATDEASAVAIVTAFRASPVDRSNPRDVLAAIENFASVSWPADDPRMIVRPGPLTSSQLDWLHEILADEAMPAKVRGAAFERINAGHNVRDDELDMLLADPGILIDERAFYGAAALAELARERGRVDEARALAIRVYERGDVRYGRLVLVAHAHEETLTVAERANDPAAISAIRAALRGTAVLDEVIAVAEELAVRAEAGDERARTALSDLIDALPLGANGTTGHELCESAAILREPNLPGWFRARLNQRWQRTLTQYDDTGSYRGNAHPPLSHEPAEAIAELVAAWRDSVDLAGDEVAPWQPPDLTSKYDLETTLDDVRDLSTEQEAWFRERLHDPDRPVDAMADSYLLEALVACDRLTRDDADQLLVGWRKRFVRAPDPYSRFQPGLVSLAVGLHQLDHPRAGEIITAIGALKQKWATPAAILMRAFDGTDHREEVLAQVDVFGLAHAARMASVLIDAREQGTTPLHSALGGGTAPFAPWIDGALELATAHPRLLNPRALGGLAVHREAAARLAEDESLTEGLRASFRDR